MELKFKSLQGSTFTVNAEPSDTIAAVKGKVEAAQGHAASAQKIIYSGKILTDADTVQSCGVSEKDFLVLMISKPKAAKPAAPAASSAAPPASTAATASAPSAESATPASAAASTPAAGATSTQAPPAAAAEAPSGAPGSSQFLTGAKLEEAVNNICEMGFEKSEVQKAMRASFNNPERAVEYLMTGIPEYLNQPQQQAQAQPPQQPPAAGGGAGTGAGAGATPAAPPAAAARGGNAPSNPRAGNLFEAAAAQAQGGGGAGAGAGGRGAGAGGGGDGMQALRDLGEDDGSGNTALDLGNPAMLAQLRQLVQQNPAALAPLVQALAQSNPQLAAAMAENPEGMLELLASGAAQRALGGEGGEDDESVPLPSMADLSQEDRTAVEQIVAMGIEEQRAIEVYLMCGRNVEMAVQYYFENPQDFED